MRLDHLLSKEQCRRETGGTHPKVDLSESLVRNAEEAKEVVSARCIVFRDRGSGAESGTLKTAQPDGNILRRNQKRNLR